MILASHVDPVGALTLLLRLGAVGVARAGAIVVAGVTLLLRVRSPIGIHASGSMVAVTFTAAALGLAVGSAGAVGLSLGFIGAEASFAYLVAGFSKFQEPRWRRGQAITLIAGTSMWGDRRQALLLGRHPNLGTALCWATMVGECAVPLALIAPLPVALAILGVALVFHIGVAVQMGLNAFVWAFASTYPAIIFCNSWLHGHL